MRAAPTRAAKASPEAIEHSVFKRERLSRGQADMTTPPVIRLKPPRGARRRTGHPWVYSNEIDMDDAARACPPGETVRLLSANGEALGLASFNPHSLIAARQLTTDTDSTIDEAFWTARLRRALAIRERLYLGPYYRLIHSEADGFPGLVADRYGDAVVLQVNSASMERALPDLIKAVEEVLAAKTIVIRADSRVRELEGLERYVRVTRGQLDGLVELQEDGVRALADLENGQKTGWYYDQRDNRRFAAQLAKGARVLDLYCSSGGFSLATAQAGAHTVVGLDSSEPALDIARQAAVLNGVEGRCHFERAKLFDAGEELAQDGERFDLVVADPPSFVSARRDLKPGLRAYRKLARLSASLVARDGFLVIASCSHNIDEAAFADAVARGLADAGRDARVLHRSGAGADHPVHPALPETSYLKCLGLALD